MIEKIKADFLTPPDEFTPIPFWFWNDYLSEDTIKEQIHDFYHKGVKGFVIHPRIGIPKEIEYLSDRFMELVTYAVTEADKLGMKVVLYDEAMYPSGSAHGMVVKRNPSYASKALKMKEYQCYGNIRISLDDNELKNLVSVQAIKKISENEIVPDSICKVPVVNNEIYFNPDETGQWWLLLIYQTFTEGHIRGIHFGEDDGEEAAPASADLLMKEATLEFISLTHEKYYKVLHKFFGNTIIGMFTDEPCIMGRGNMTGLRPWTDNFLEYYIAQGNQELDLPFLWFEGGEISEVKRKKYEEAISKRMEETFYGPISQWCEEHQIALTGHPEKSDDIGFLKYFHIPSQDLVYRWVAPENNLGLEGQHSTMAKCSSDSARHRGRRRNGNECFACCGKNGIEWSFSVDDMKWYMDWLFVRGVNLLYPHAFFYSIHGDRRSGERPPDVGPNNIWWPYYKKISDYMKRMCYLMTDSVNQTHLAVLCSTNELPWKIVKPLYENQMEFNYLEKELLLSEECMIDQGNIKIAEQTYQVLIVEDIKLLDQTVLSKLQYYIGQGGSVIVYNPDGIDIGISNIVYLNAYSELVDILSNKVSRNVITAEKIVDLRVSHIQKQGYDFYVFANEGENEINSRVRLKARGIVERWDAWKGRIDRIENIKILDDGYMELELHMQRRETAIFLIHSDSEVGTSIGNSHKVSYELREKVLLCSNWYMGTDTRNLRKMEALVPWNEICGMENFSGTMIYQCKFNIKNHSKFAKVELDLGEVCEIAQVTLNGEEIDVQMWSPYIYDITGAIKEGLNDLVIEVKNTVANRICKLNLTSGLMGPVQLLIYS